MNSEYADAYIKSYGGENKPMASLTQRSLIRFGKGIAITLPKGWTDYYGLKPGDKVNVKVNSRLIITIVRKEKDSAESVAALTESANQSINGGDPTHGNCL